MKRQIYHKRIILIILVNNINDSFSWGKYSSNITYMCISRTFYDSDLSDFSVALDALGGYK